MVNSIVREYVLSLPFPAHLVRLRPCHQIYSITNYQIFLLYQVTVTSLIVPFIKQSKTKLSPGDPCLYWLILFFAPLYSQTLQKIYPNMLYPTLYSIYSNWAFALIFPSAVALRIANDLHFYQSQRLCLILLNFTTVFDRLGHSASFLIPFCSLNFQVATLPSFTPTSLASPHCPWQDLLLYSTSVERMLVVSQLSILPLSIIIESSIFSWALATQNKVTDYIFHLLFVLWQCN